MGKSILEIIYAAEAELEMNGFKPTTILMSADTKKLLERLIIGSHTGGIFSIALYNRLNTSHEFLGLQVEEVSLPQGILIVSAKDAPCNKNAVVVIA